MNFYLMMYFIKDMISKKKIYPGSSKRAYIVTVNMGYGHQRTSLPLRKFACPLEFTEGEIKAALDGKIINANDYPGIPKKDREIWDSSRDFYEFVSKFKRVPLIGEFIFSLYDKFQNISSYYPKRDLSKATFGLKRIYSTIKKGWGKDLISKFPAKSGISSQREKRNLPLVTTFFIPAFMAEIFDYPSDIFCVICDADISRAWAPLEPAKSRIKYFTPNTWVANRLKLYGVREENIFFSGYPLPIENIGTEKMEILKEDLGRRLLNLDPTQKYRFQYKSLLEEKIGPLPEKSGHPLTIMFSIGGAGAQKKIVGKYLKSLAKKIRERKIKVILSAGIREKIKRYFLGEIKKLKLEEFFGENIYPVRNSENRDEVINKSISNGVEIIFEKKIGDYFSLFNQKLRETDILWTKPSELSFYSALGIPIIIAPPIGSQEDFNKKWLLHTDAGILEEKPEYANQWIFDSLKSGRFAEAAVQGFIKGKKLGVFNIQQIIS